MNSKFFFCSLFLYQFIFAIFFQKNNLYFILSPYSFSILLISLFFYVNLRDPVFRNFIQLYFFMFIILIIIFMKFLLLNQVFTFLIIKNFQFVFGTLILVPGILIFKKILRLHKSEIKINYQQLIEYILIFVSSITLIEYLMVVFLNFKPSDIFYLNSSFINFIDTNKNNLGPFNYRPYGFLFYPQPNGVLIAFLLSIYINLTRRFNFIFLFGTISLIISQSYSGLYLYLFSIIFVSDFKNKNFIIILLILIFLIGYLFFYSSQYFYKLSFDYFEVLLFREHQLIDQILSIRNLNIFEFFIGRSSNFKEISHEWAYTSIFREFGLIGLTIYFITYSKIIYHLLPLNMQKGSKYLFVIIFLSINFHYPSISFMPFQILLIIFYSVNSENLYKSPK